MRGLTGSQIVVIGDGAAWIWTHRRYEDIDGGRRALEPLRSQCPPGPAMHDQERTRRVVLGTQRPPMGGLNKKCNIMQQKQWLKTTSQSPKIYRSPAEYEPLEVF